MEQLKTAEEFENPNSLDFNRLSSFKDKAVAVLAGLTAVAGTATSVVWNNFDQVGDVHIHQPANRQDDALIAGSPNAITWNMENKVVRLLPKIIKIDKALDPGVILIQEGSADAPSSIGLRMPDRYVTSVLTDSKHNMSGGGQALILITKNEPKDITEKVFNGPSFINTTAGVLAGLGSDLVTIAQASPSFDNTKEGLQESRVTVAFTVKAWVNGKLKEVRYITGHNTPFLADQDEQTKGNLKFIKDNLQPGRPSVVCLDWNLSPEDIVPKLTALGFITPETDVTSIHGKRLDYCSYNTGGIKRLLFTAVSLKGENGSDHVPVSLSVKKSIIKYN